MVPPPRRRPTPDEIKAAFVVSPFTRLARVHAASMAGDSLVAIALAGSLFFSIAPGTARWRVALYLLLTMAPFSVVAPLIGPAIDRAAGGRRLIVLATCAGRAVMASLMVLHVNQPFLFPEAFVLLVLSKGYVITKAALVPTTVASDAELVEANSKLGILAGVMAFAAAIPGVPLLKAGPQWVLGLAAATYFVAMLFGAFLPRVKVAIAPPAPAEVAELHSAGVLLAVTAMASLRAAVGFLTFHVAFWFRHTGTPKWWFGVVVGFSALGNLAGMAIAPVLRRSVREERMLTAAMVFAGVSGIGTALSGGRTSAALLAFALAMSAAIGRQAFDAIVQRDAPDANRGRSFARFETRFQLVWVAAGFLPVVIPFPGGLGFFIVGLITAMGATTYLWGHRYVRLHSRRPDPFLGKLWREVDARRRTRTRLARGAATGEATPPDWKAPNADEQRGEPPA